MLQLQIFKYVDENRLNELTTVEINGEIWFVAKDVCDLLELANSRQAVASLEEDERLVYTLDTSGQNRRVNLVNESGLYSLIFKSRKESARKFRQWVTKEVLPAIRKKGSYGIDRSEPPNFILRYMENYHRIGKGYFSVITELYVRLYAQFEHVGYKIPNRAFDGKEMRPDVSVGLCFAKYLREKHPDVCDNHKPYLHKFQSGLEVEARQYPNELLPLFIKFVDDVWIPKNAQPYFKERDLKALDYLPKLLKKSA